MVKLNHPVKIDNKTVTPFLVQGDNVLCFNRRKETVFVPVDKFNLKKKKTKLVVPVQTTSPAIVPKAVIKKVDPPKEEIIKIKKEVVEEKEDLTFSSTAIIKLSGSAKTNFIINEKIIEEAVPPVVDNSRYVRPTLDDDYI